MPPRFLTKRRPHLHLPSARGPRTAIHFLRIFPLTALFLGGPLAGCGLAAAHLGTPQPPSTGNGPRPAPLPPQRGAPIRDASVPFACSIDAPRLLRAGTPVELGEKTTVYPHSWPDRNQNLLTATRFLCGRILTPGQTLSFNAAIGETTVARGYAYGPTFVGNRVVPGLGGGVCQVASTLYDAARFGVVRVLERHQHGMRVPYVAPGEDATVSSPYLDLVIENSTQGPLLLAAGARGPAVRVAIYGAKSVGHGHFEHETLGETPFPTLRIEDSDLPSGVTREVQEGSTGARTRTWYVVTAPDGRVRRYDLGVDDYRPSPQIVRVGTGRAAPKSATPGAG